jgi:hypothetical protein
LPPLTVKLKVVDAPAASEPFQALFFTVTVLPLVVWVPFHSEVMLVPDAMVSGTVHLVMAELPALTVTVPL